MEIIFEFIEKLLILNLMVKISIFLFLLLVKIVNRQLYYILQTICFYSLYLLVFLFSNRIHCKETQTLVIHIN